MRGDLRIGMVQALADFWDAGQNADYVVASSFGYGGAEAASVRGVPLAHAFLADLRRQGAGEIRTVARR